MKTKYHKLREVGRKYAKAIASLYAPADTEDINSWLNFSDFFHHLVAIPTISSVIDNPFISPKKQVELLQQCARSCDLGLNVMQNNFLYLLADEKKLLVLKVLFPLLSEYFWKICHYAHVEIIVPKEFSQIDKNFTQTLLVKLQSLIKGNVHANFRHDARILAGAKLSFADIYIDATLKGKLAGLLHNMLQ